MKLIGYDSDSVSEDYFFGRYKIPKQALHDHRRQETKRQMEVKAKMPKRVSGIKQDLLNNGAQCYICSRVLTELNFTWDHVHPKSKGGKLKRECCKNCNWEKKDMTVAEYIEFLSGRNDVVSLQKVERLLKLG